MTAARVTIHYRYTANIPVSRQCSQCLARWCERSNTAVANHTASISCQFLQYFPRWYQKGEHSSSNSYTLGLLPRIFKGWVSFSPPTSAGGAAQSGAFRPLRYPLPLLPAPNKPTTRAQQTLPVPHPSTFPVCTSPGTKGR